MLCSRDGKPARPPLEDVPWRRCTSAPCTGNILLGWSRRCYSKVAVQLVMGVFMTEGSAGLLLACVLSTWDLRFDLANS
jgi:hypothetical protein